MSTYSAGSVVGSIGGVVRSAADAAGTLLDVLGIGSDSWLRSLQQASFGGVNFGVDTNTLTAGRKTVVHEYAFRDEVWVEDLGKKARRFSVAGFLLEGDVVYGGGSVIQQREAMLKVVEEQLDALKPGHTLVHPTLGKIDHVCCVNFESVESKTIGACFEIRFDFIVSGARKYPAAAASDADRVADAANEVREASALDYLKNVAAAVKQGAAVVKQAIRTAVAWYTKVITLINDVRRVFRSISNLAGNFGSMFGGANAGYSGKNVSAPTGSTTSSLLAADTAARAAVSTAGNALTVAAATPGDATAMAQAAATVASTLAATASDPADGVRLLTSLAQYEPADSTTDSQVGVAMATVQSALGALFRRAAIAQLAEVVRTYQPSSSEDALALRNAVADLIEDEMRIAGDAGDDNSYLALMELRAALISDLMARGAQLAAMRDFTFKVPMNSLVLAQRIYRDSDRADGLVLQAQPVHPAFMPMEFTGLSK